MKDYIRYVLKSDLSVDQVFELLSHAFLTRVFPTFKWWRARDDYPEPYIRGVSSDLVGIDIYPEEYPFVMTVSFRGAWPNAPDREGRKRQLIDLISTNLIPPLGQIVKVKEHT